MSVNQAMAFPFVRSYGRVWIKHVLICRGSQFHRAANRGLLRPLRVQGRFAASFTVLLSAKSGSALGLLFVSLRPTNLAMWDVFRIASSSEGVQLILPHWVAQRAILTRLSRFVDLLHFTFHGVSCDARVMRGQSRAMLDIRPSHALRERR
jgi:hypothetical protein